MMKMEEGASPGGGYMDDEFYEDTGELQMPREGEQNAILLARIPDWLYEHISDWDKLAQGNDNDVITIGEVLALPEGNAYDQAKENKEKIKGAQPAGPPKPPSMRVFFDQVWNQRTTAPTAFEIEGQSVNDTVLHNTMVFTEKDYPGYKPNGVGRNNPQSFNGAVQDPNARVNKPRSKYRKAIPKQTALVGSAHRQYITTPLNTKEYIDFSTNRTKIAIQGRNNTTEILEQPIDEITTMNNLQDRFTSFIRPTHKPRSQQNKYTRMPQNELLDMLHQAFDEYKYWGLRALKTKTRQPEAYLKEVLPLIAVMMKSGSFAQNWTRQESFNRPSQHEGMGDDTVDMDDDDEEEMEDVL